MNTNAHAVTFTVNGESVETTERELTVRQILILATLDPEIHYLVEKRGHNQEIEHRDLSEQIHVHEKQEFLAFFTGPTPVS
jgi:hypothetical protein